MSEVAATVKQGTRVRVGGVITPLGGTTPTDPTTVKVRVRPPTGDVETFVYGTDAAVEKVDVGEYEYRRVLDEPGTWWLSLVAESASSGVSVVNEVAVKVTRSATA